MENKMKPEALARYSSWTQATIEALRDRARFIERVSPDAADKLRAAADAVDAAWEIVDESLVRP